MSWSGEQWDTFAALLDRGWPGDLADGAEAAYRTLLDDVPPEAAVQGLRRLLYAGHKWRPSAAELIAAAREDPTRPTFAEAYALMFGTRGATSDDPRDGIHPLVTSFVRRHGASRLRLIPFDDPDWGEKHRRDLERDWQAHLSAMEGRETAALASGDGEPRQLDPLGMANLLPPDLDRRTLGA